MSSDWMFVTFGAGLPNWRGAARRLGRQAEDSGFFSQVRVYTERELTRDHPDFMLQHRAILTSRVRGFGYWIWKPFLIWKSLEYARTSGLAGVTYLDAGCELNLRSDDARKRLLAYRRLALKNGVFAMHLVGCSERQWSRLDVLNHFGLSQPQRGSPQVQGTPMFPSSDGAVAFARAWFEACVQDDYFLVRDAMPGELQDPEFCDHRHDQSVFSGMIKQQQIETIPDETFWAEDWLKLGLNYPYWAARNRTRVSLVDSSAKGRAIRLGERLYSRAYSDLRRLYSGTPRPVSFRPR